jgi:hypothetical protein
LLTLIELALLIHSYQHFSISALQLFTNYCKGGALYSDAGYGTHYDEGTSPSVPPESAPCVSEALLKEA